SSAVRGLLVPTPIFPLVSIYRAAAAVETTGKPRIKIVAAANVDTSLTRTSRLGNELLAPTDAEPYVPFTEQDLIDYGVDQISRWGTFTRFTPPVAFSHTPSMALARALLAGHRSRHHRVDGESGR